MDGAFLDLDAEQVDGEVDDFSREIYKIQKVFNTKLKKMQMEVDEINREKKKKRRMTEDDDGEINPEDQDIKLQVPQGFNICSTVMDNTKDFKVCESEYKGSALLMSSFNVLMEALEITNINYLYMGIFLSYFSLRKIVMVIPALCIT